jgi:hypothetical protein
VIVQARLAHLKGIKPHEWAVRFVFGGLCTMLAGLIAKHFGPAVGGLFLAFPAIFPASASLIEQHEIMHKQRIGKSGQTRGRVLAGIDAAGAAIACCGLAGFAVIVWKGLPGHGGPAVIAAAMVAWILVSISLWLLGKSRLLRRRPPVR